MKDSVVKRHGSLEIEEDMGAQRRLWRFQRAGRIFFAVILLAALAGAFGKGPLSHAEFKNESVTLEYERIAYRESPQDFQFTIRAPETHLWISNETLKDLEIQKMVPEPESSAPLEGKTVFIFSPGIASANRQVTVSFKAKAAGTQKIQFGLANNLVTTNSSSEVKQFVLP